MVYFLADDAKDQEYDRQCAAEKYVSEEDTSLVEVDPVEPGHVSSEWGVHSLVYHKGSEMIELGIAIEKYTSAVIPVEG
jgi:hypothetical protein